MDAAARAFFEPRLGHDFRHVRVHDDQRAGESARSVNARAYTVGGDVVFGARAFRPESEQGRRLIAHELAHVVQQRDAGPGGDAPVVNRVSRPCERAEAEAEAASASVSGGPAPRLAGVSEGGVLHRADGDAEPAPAAPFYQEAVDALAEERSKTTTIVKGQIVPGSVTVLEKLVALCEAIERGSAPDVKTLLDDFLASSALGVSLSTPSNSLVNEMVGRMMLLGMDAESATLRRWGLERERSISPPIGGGYAREIANWKDVEKRLLEQIPEAGGAEGLKALDGLILFFGQVVREIFSLSEAEIVKDRQKRVDLKGNLFVEREQQSISVYNDELVGLMRETFAGIQSALQVVLDQAAEDLAAGRGGAMLQSAKDRLDGRLQPLIDPADKNQRIGGVPVELTNSEFREGGGVHRDALAKTEEAKAERSVNVQFYDAAQPPESAKEMSSDFGVVFLARKRQVLLLEEIYGVQKDDKGDLTPETKENAAAMASLGAEGLRLHSDDDWRKFVAAKFELREATDGREKALMAVMELLEKYMSVFTSHTPYNIEDFGDNYLTKTFPRDLAGRLIHDCGVYGLRMAYILSLLRDHPKLQLKFRYVVMPVHVGLLITGDGLPTFLVNNDDVVPYTAADVEALRGEWDELDERGEKKEPPQPGTEARFSGELMAHAFLEGVDLPYKQSDVVKPAASTEQTKAALWRQYTREIAPEAGRLFGPSVSDPKSPNYQFHLRYLKLLDLFKDYHNASLVPFWNVEAPRLWEEHRDEVTKTYAELQKATPEQKAAAQAAYSSAVARYEGALEEKVELVKREAKPIYDEQHAIQEHIAAHPELFPADTEVKSAARVAAMFQALGVLGQEWENAVYTHLSDLHAGKPPEPPFGRPEQKMMPLD